VFHQNEAHVTNAPSGYVLLAGLAIASLGLGACDDDAPLALIAGDAADDAGDRDASSTDAAFQDAQTDAEVIRTVRDRCNGSSCVPARLVPQEDLEFLEDMGDGWLRLMEADWELSPTSEGYRCMSFTVPEDVLIGAFSPRMPVGTHHASFEVTAAPVRADRVYACSAASQGDKRLQGGGAGSEPTFLPEGIAMRVHRGEQITMNLHLFNVTDETLTGRSGMWIKTVSESEVEHEAETILAGPLTLTVPVGRSTQRGGCTVPQDTTVFAVGPHMHQKGVHMRVTAAIDGEEVELYDDAYDFFHQVMHPIEAVKLRTGDIVSVECTYENDSDATIYWGDSSLDEMCFVALSMYPADAFSGGPCLN
jgi:hypothetical protein